MSRRNERLESTIARETQKALSKGLNDPRARGLMTVTKVELTPDRRTATVFVSVVPAEREELTMHALHDAAGHVRHEIADRIPLPRTPQLRFKNDKTIKTQQAVIETINREAQALRDREAESKEPEEGA